MYVSLIEALCEEFKCTPNRLRILMQHPYYVDLARAFLKGKMLRTTYKKRTPRCFKMAELTVDDAHGTHAYEGKKDISVDTHYYCKYHIELRFPELPLVAMEMGNTGHKRFFALELLRIAFTSL